MDAVTWRLSHRYDRVALPMANRHYNRQTPDSPQFVKPGRNVVLIQPGALWVSSWQEHVRHAWPGAWENSLFRKESAGRASDMIREAIACTRFYWTAPPEGLITFVDPEHVPPTMVRGKPIYGYCYMKAGFTHVGFSKRGLWCWHLAPEAMPPARAPLGAQMGML
jgi:hypothetical protein